MERRNGKGRERGKRKGRKERGKEEGWEGEEEEGWREESEGGEGIHMHTWESLNLQPGRHSVKASLWSQLASYSLHFYLPSPRSVPFGFHSLKISPKLPSLLAWAGGLSF